MTATLEELKAPVQKLGVISFVHKDNAAADVKFDRIAHDGSTLEMVSLIAEPMRIKAIRAILLAKGKPFIRAAGVATKHPSQGDLYGTGRPGDMYPDEAGYDIHLHKMDYGMAHAVFVTRNRDFIRYLSPDSLWQHLNSDRHSTPLLREWMPYVAKELVSRRFLRECRCYRCNSGVLSLKDDAHLDEIVTEGIKYGAISVP
jgi:hypothetical protein